MKFSSSTIREARFRQKGRCADCGRDLDDLWEEAHHIHPHSLGGRDHVDNCVILCDMCHERVHYNGYYRSCIVAPKSYFEHYYG